MNEFFDAPLPRPVEAELRYRMPPWLAAPRGTLPGVVALDLVLARTEKVAVCISRAAAYATGFELDVITMSAQDDDEIDPWLFHRRRQLLHRGGGPIAPEMLRLGVQFADGSKAMNTGGRHYAAGEPPTGPIMHSGGGGGGGGSWRQSQWIWPLPPPGVLVFVCEWPALDIPLTRCEIDAQPIIDAAARAQVVFSDEHLPERPTDGGPPVVWMG